MAASTIADLKVEPREFDLWPLIEALIHDLRPLVESKPVRIVNAVPTDFLVFADAVLLNQVFQNLLSNAIRYTRSGQIVIGAGHMDAAYTAQCYVKDTGAGVPPDRLNKIFEKFETDSGTKGGQGLGLAIVKQIIEAHGGTVTAESPAGQGTTLKFTLPGKGRSKN